MADYSFKSQLTMYSDGYAGEITGADPPDGVWHDGSAEGGSVTATYYYYDSNSGSNSNASRVDVVVRDTWTAQTNVDNSITITLNTAILGIMRSHVAGNPESGLPGVGRTIALSTTLAQSRARQYIHKYAWWSVTDYTQKETIPSIPTRTLTLEPGESTTVKNSLFVHNWCGTKDNPDMYYKDPAVNDPFNDSMGIGMAFRNNLKKAYGHCIYYDANGGRDAPVEHCWSDEEECSTFNITMLEPNSPHWVFLGWHTNKDATEPKYKPGDEITVCDSVTLYAIWRYTYRPGQCMHDGIFYSHDRDGATGPEGRANVRKGNKWIEMRIDPIHTGLEDPPVIERSGWKIQKLIGRDGVPHHIDWDCPHEWS